MVELALGEPQSWRAMLEAKPLRNAASRMEREANGMRTLHVPCRRPWYAVFPLTWIVRFPEERSFRLDPLGAQVWDLCSGEAPVEAIVEAFAEEHELTFHEARVAVTQYLKTLIQYGALAIALASEEDDAAKEATS